MSDIDTESSNKGNCSADESLKEKESYENCSIKDSSFEEKSDKSITIHSQIIIKSAESVLENNDQDLKKENSNKDINFEIGETNEIITEEAPVSMDYTQEIVSTGTQNDNLSEKVAVVSLIAKTDVVDSLCSSELKDADLTITSTTPLLNVNIKNTSLGFLQSQYSSSDSDPDSDSEVSEKIESRIEADANSNDSEPVVVDQNYRDQILEIESDSSSSDSDVEIVHEDMRKKIIEFEAAEEEDIEDDEENIGGVKKHNDHLRVKGELLLHELPPIQDLQITVAEEECVELGKIHSIVDQLVLVDSISGTVPLNLDTVLFLEKGQKMLGEIFDVLGQITNPLYCVRFNSHKQILEKGIEVGQTVYVAPRTEHTHFVILSEIMKIRGSDASWKHDMEPSPRHIDFSDDEEERNYRRSFANKSHNSRPNENSEQKKRSRTFSSTSSQISDTSTVTTQPRRYAQNVNYRGRGNPRFSRPYRQQPQFQPRNQPVYNNVYLQNPPAYNYDQFNNSWHTNYNFNDNNNYQSSDFRNGNNQNYRQNQFANHNITSQEQVFYQPPENFNQSISDAGSSSIYPNPYAIRPNFIPPNLMQQPLYPPHPPPNTDN